MEKKKAIIGFKGVVLAEITEDSIVGYKTEEAFGVPYAGKMSRTAKETSQDVYYDDDLYAQIKSVEGEEVEVRFGEMSLELFEKLGLGVYDKDTGTLEADFNVQGKAYSLRCVTDTVGHVPYYFNWRVFELTGLRFDNFATKGSSITVCEAIMTGVFKRPLLASAKPSVIRMPKEDGSNLAELDAWLKAAETLPGA